MARETGVTTSASRVTGGRTLRRQRTLRDRPKRFSLYRHVPAFLRKGLIEPVSSLLPQNESRFSLPRRYVKRANILFRAAFILITCYSAPRGRNVRACFTGKRSTANLAEHSRRTLSYCRSVR